MGLNNFIASRSKFFLGYGSLCLAILAWGVSIPLNKILIKDLDPLLTLIIQLCGSAALFSVAAYFLKIKINWHKDQVLLIFLIGILEPAVAYYFGFIGVQHTTAMHAAIIYAMEPAGIIALNALIFQKKTAWSLVVVILISIGGIALIAVDGSQEKNGESLKGDLLVMAGVMAASLYVSLSSRFVDSVNIIKMLLLQQFGSLFFLTFLWVGGNLFGQIEIKYINLTSVINCFVVGVVQFGFSFFFYFTGIKYITGIAGILILNMVSVVGIISSAIILGEEFNYKFVIGSFVVIMCMLYASIKERH